MTRSEGSNELTHARSALAIMVSFVDYYGQETIASLYVPFVKQQVFSGQTCNGLVDHVYINTLTQLYCYPGLHACMAKRRI